MHPKYFHHRLNEYKRSLLAHVYVVFRSEPSESKERIIHKKSTSDQDFSAGYINKASKLKEIISS